MMSPMEGVVKDLRLEDNDKDLQMQIDPRGQRLSTRLDYNEKWLTFDSLYIYIYIYIYNQ